MKIIKKTCTCGNVITVTMTKTGDKEYSRKVEGAINMDFNNVAICSCHKVHYFNRSINAWWNKAKQL